MAAQAPAKIDRQETTPFLLRLFYKNHGFHRLDEFASPRLPQHLQIYTWQTCTLSELTNLMLPAMPSLLPNPYAGTRIAYRLVYPDMQGPSRPGSQPRFISRDLGSVIVGAEPVDGDGHAEAMDVDPRDAEDGANGETSAAAGKEAVRLALKQLKGELDKTLQDARFVIGDYICAAIFPPLPDGSVAAAPPPPSAPLSRGPPPRNEYGRGGPRENGFGPRGGGGDYGYGRGSGLGGGRGGPRFDDRRGGLGGGGMPSGEWRRGEAPPERDGGGYYGRGSSRGRGRGRW